MRVRMQQGLRRLTRGCGRAAAANGGRGQRIIRMAWAGEVGEHGGSQEAACACAHAHKHSRASTHTHTHTQTHTHTRTHTLSLSFSLKHTHAPHETWPCRRRSRPPRSEGTRKLRRAAGGGTSRRTRGRRVRACPSTGCDSLPITDAAGAQGQMQAAKHAPCKPHATWRAPPAPGLAGTHLHLCSRAGAAWRGGRGWRVPAQGPPSLRSPGMCCGLLYTPT